MHILEAVTKLRPGTHWNLRGNILEQCEGESKVDVPGWDEITALVDADAYREKRAKEYPTIGDQLDALWKGGDAASVMLKQVQDVKVKYPKS